MTNEKPKQRKKRASRFDWQALIEQQQTSGIPVAQFCRDNQLSTSAFYNNRVQLFPHLCESKKFVPAQIMPETKPVSSSFILTHANNQLSIPTSTSPDIIVALMRGLST